MSVRLSSFKRSCLDPHVQDVAVEVVDARNPRIVRWIQAMGTHLVGIKRVSAVFDCSIPWHLAEGQDRCAICKYTCVLRSEYVLLTKMEVGGIHLGSALS